MLIFNDHYTHQAIVHVMKTNALQGTADGTDSSKRYISSCTGYHPRSGTSIIFTRDEGHHSCGWWKNPDYERCFHLSLSFIDPITIQIIPFDKKLAGKWVNYFFGENSNMLWVEPPYKVPDVWHYRLFCNEYWAPIIPRKEVYSKYFTEKGWKSYSEINKA